MAFLALYTKASLLTQSSTRRCVLYFMSQVEQDLILILVPSLQNRPLNMVVHLNVPDSVIMARIAGTSFFLCAIDVTGMAGSLTLYPQRDGSISLLVEFTTRPTLRPKCRERMM